MLPEGLFSCLPVHPCRAAGGIPAAAAVHSPEVALAGHTAAVLHRGVVGRIVQEAGAAGHIAVQAEAVRMADTAEEDTVPVGLVEDTAAVRQQEGNLAEDGPAGELLAAEVHPELRPEDNSLGRRAVGPVRSGRTVAAGLPWLLLVNVCGVCDVYETDGTSE